MSCEGCKTNKKDETIKEEAQALANETRQWVGIYKDEHGDTKFCLGEQTKLYPCFSFVSPNNDLRHVPEDTLKRTA